MSAFLVFGRHIGQERNGDAQGLVKVAKRANK